MIFRSLLRGSKREQDATQLRRRKELTQVCFGVHFVTPQSTLMFVSRVYCRDSHPESIAFPDWLHLGFQLNFERGSRGGLETVVVITASTLVAQPKEKKKKKKKRAQISAKGFELAAPHII